jgi:hypothetical protein
MMALIKKGLPIEVVGGKYWDRHGMLRVTMCFMCYVDLNGAAGQKCIMKSNVKMLMTFLPQEDEELATECSKSNDSQCDDVHHHIAALESRVQVLEADNERLRSVLMKLP